MKKVKKWLKYRWNALVYNQEYLSNYDTSLAVAMMGWCSNCGENPAHLCVTASENPAHLCVTASENLAGGRDSNCRDTYTLATGAHTQT